MTNESISTFEDLVSELERDPEFRKEYRRQKPYYDLLLEIIRHRKRLNLTQKELARRAGTHQSCISRIESGEHDIRLSTLIDIAEALEAKARIRLVPIFYIEDEEYRNLVNVSANNKPASKSTISSTIEKKMVTV